MKKLYFLFITLIFTSLGFGQSIFINEIHYDNDGGDIDEGIEIVGPAGTDLAGYKIYLYNGDGNTYAPTSISLSGIIPNQQNNRGTLWFTQVGIQNGSPDGLALVDDLGMVIQFLSYEGVITAIAGPALGLTSSDIGVSEPGTIGESLQLIGTGNVYNDFSWVGPVPASPGMLNTNQTLSVVKNQIAGFSLYPNPVVNGKFVITSSNRIAKELKIYSMIGQRMYSKSVQANEAIDVSNLNRGIYLLRIEEEGKIATSKLVIK